VTNDSNLPRQLTKADLISIYQCQIPGITPYIPQAGSGTRSFWLSYLGITDVTLFPCIKDAKNGVPIEEHDGRVLDANSLIPISVAQNIAQAEGTLTDLRGKSVLGTIDGTLPQTLNGGFAVKREIYNVVPTS